MRLSHLKPHCGSLWDSCTSESQVINSVPHWTAQTCALSVSASLCVYRTKITEEQKIRRKRKPSTQLRVGTVQSICSARGRPWAPFLPRENQQRWGVQLKVWGSSPSPRYPGHQSPLVNCSETSAVSGVVGGMSPQVPHSCLVSTAAPLICSSLRFLVEE